MSEEETVSPCEDDLIPGNRDTSTNSINTHYCAKYARKLHKNENKIQFNFINVALIDNNSHLRVLYIVR